MDWEEIWNKKGKEVREGRIRNQEVRTNRKYLLPVAERWSIKVSISGLGRGVSFWGFKKGKGEMESIVFNQDCMIGMRNTPDKFYDLAVVDPPYGGGQHFNFRFGTGNEVYENRKPDAEYWTELFRVSKNQIVWGGNYFTAHLPESRCWISWYKGNPLDSFSDFELAWTSFDQISKAVKIESYGFNHADKRTRGEKTIHPTQKPVALYDWTYSNYLPGGGAKY